MAYIKNGWLSIKSGTDELIIDELDEDAVEIEAEIDKVNVRYTTKGKAASAADGQWKQDINNGNDIGLTLKKNTKAVAKTHQTSMFFKKPDPLLCCPVPNRLNA